METIRTKSGMVYEISLYSIRIFKQRTDGLMHIADIDASRSCAWPEAALQAVAAIADDLKFAEGGWRDV